MKILFILITLILFSCTHSQQKADFESLLARKQCTEAYNNIPESKRMKAISIAKEASGRAASYLLTGLGFTSDTVLVSGVVIAGGSVCYPLYKAFAATKNENERHGIDTNEGELLAYCALLAPAASYMGAKKTLKKLYQGKKTYHKTSRWRCPRLNPISRSIRKVAQCYRNKGELEKARNHLNNLNSDELFSKCLSLSEKKEVSKALENI